MPPLRGTRGLLRLQRWLRLHGLGQGHRQRQLNAIFAIASGRSSARAAPRHVAAAHPAVLPAGRCCDVARPGSPRCTELREGCLHRAGRSVAKLEVVIHARPKTTCLLCTANHLRGRRERDKETQTNLEIDSASKQAARLRSIVGPLNRRLESASQRNDLTK